MAESSSRKQHSEWAGPGAPAGFTVVSPHSIQMCELSWPWVEGDSALCTGGQGLMEQSDFTFPPQPHKIPTRLF